MKQGQELGIILIVIAFLGSFLLVKNVLAHPGNTDASGCHTCRTNCPSWGLDYGEYHCHQAKALPQPEEPIKSTYGEGGTGTTRPAPEYEAPKVQADTNNTIPINNNSVSAQTINSRSNEDNKNSSEEESNVLTWLLVGGGAGAFGYWLAKRK